MKRATVVIGSSYGDEGKGKIVDYLASKLPDNKSVVRFNGGAQAGHTVVTPDGKRHVFHHLGSGSFTGARTYLAKHFVCNPILFWHEYQEFAKLSGLNPIVAADPRCFITTPYDMLINQLVEDERGADRHGSCGVGFGETIERNNYPAFRLLKEDLKRKDELKQKLINIRDHWMPARLSRLKTRNLEKRDTRLSDHMLDGFIQAAISFDEAVATAGAEFIERNPIIFEGAQGLALDMDRGDFPHVTRSNTGLTNVLPIAKVLGLQLDIIYVTRPYLTRHGAGPLKNVFVPRPPIVDETNISHPYQGQMRFAALDLVALEKRISQDIAETKRPVTATVAVTCIDHKLGASGLTAGQVGKYPIKYLGVGPKRNDITTLGGGK